MMISELSYEEKILQKERERELNKIIGMMAKNPRQKIDTSRYEAIKEQCKYLEEKRLTNNSIWCIMKNDKILQKDQREDMSEMKNEKNIIQLLNDLKSGMEDIKTEQVRTNERLDALEAGQARMNERLDALEAGQARTNERLDALEAGQAQTNERLDALEAGQVRMGERLDALEAGQVRMGERLDALEAGQARTNERLDALEAGQARMTEKMENLESNQNFNGERLEAIEADQSSVKKMLNALKAGQNQMNEKLSRMEIDLTSVRLTQENDLDKYFKFVSEGHADLDRKLNQALQSEGEREFLSVKLTLMERDIRVLNERMEKAGLS